MLYPKSKIGTIVHRSSLMIHMCEFLNMNGESCQRFPHIMNKMSQGGYFVHHISCNKHGANSVKIPLVKTVQCLQGSTQKTQQTICFTLYSRTNSGQGCWIPECRTDLLPLMACWSSYWVPVFWIKTFRKILVGIIFFKKEDWMCLFGLIFIALKSFYYCCLEG